MGERVLIVDDEEHIRRMMRLTLEAAGFTVADAADGHEGLQLYGDGSEWDVVVLDQRMPGMDGLETLRRLKAIDPKARVVMATAYASIELAVDAMKLGASDFVRKPMTPEILRAAVSAALSKASRTEQTSTISAEEATPALIHTVTMNGFEILHPAELGGPESSEPRERVFRVKNPRGWEREVVVEIPDEVVAYAERMTRRRLPVENSFWTHRAERALATYLWNQGCFPERRLTLNDLTPEELDVAERWGRDDD